MSSIGFHHGAGDRARLYALMAGLLLGSPRCLAVPRRSAAAEEAPEAQPTKRRKPQGDSVSGRLGRLEDKVRDLQVMIGTLELLLRAKPGTALPQEAPAPVAASMTAILARASMRSRPRSAALTSHIEQIGRQMSALEAKLSAAPAADRAAAERRTAAGAAG